MAAARRAAADIDGIVAVGDLQWHPSVGRWAFEFDVQRPAGTTHVPARSKWYFVARETYPFGVVRVLPAHDGGVQVTFPHQMANAELLDGAPWRSGHLCLQRPEQTLSIAQGAPEPLDGVNRMLWTMQRTVEWIDAAIAGTLRHDGDTFELPEVRTDPDGEVVVTREDAMSFSDWQAAGRHGRAVLRRWPGSKYAYARKFTNAQGAVVHEENSLWAGAGTAVDSEIAWVRLNGPPTIDPWGAPVTWAQLENACDIDLVAEIHSARSCGPRPAKIDTVMLGFPVPRYFGGPASQIRWMCARIHRDQSGKIGSQWEVYFDAVYVRGGREVEWVHVDNWSDHQLFGRGALNSEDLRKRPILIIGAGAVGSHMANYLVRGGARDLTIVDGDALEVGNLTRHVLDLSHLGRNKAIALAEQLGRASPIARVRGIGQSVRALDGPVGEAIERAEIVIDCTAEDHVPSVLSQLTDDRERWFYAVSLGWKAQRAHVFSMKGTRMDQGAFVEQTTKVVELERSHRQTEKAVEPDIGCWHPAFPATGADVAMMVARALRLLDTPTDAAPKVRTADQTMDVSAPDLVPVKP